MEEVYQFVNRLYKCNIILNLNVNELVPYLSTDNSIYNLPVQTENPKITSD